MATGAGIERRAQLTEASKYYTVSYTDSTTFNNIANLQTSDAATVLAQTKARNVNDNCTSWRNEQLNAPADYNPQQWNLNEVLVFANGGKITFAVSFNEYKSGTTHDFAQDVWATCLPSQNEPSTTTFYGVGDNDTTAPGVDLDTTNANTIRVSYADAAAHNGYIVNVTGPNVQSWTLEKVDTTTTLRSPVTNNTEAPEKWVVEPVIGGARYVLTINYYNQSAPTVYTLIQDAANTTGALNDRNTGAAPVAGAGNFKLPPNNVTGPVTGPHGTIAHGEAIANLTLQNYVDLFELTDRTATVAWEFTPIGSSTPITFTGMTVPEEIVTQNRTMQNIAGVRMTVRNERGDMIGTYVVGAPAAPSGTTTYTVTIANANGITVAGDGVYTVTSSNGSTVYTVVDGSEITFTHTGTGDDFKVTTAAGSEIVSGTDVDGKSTATYTVTANVTAVTTESKSVSVTVNFVTPAAIHSGDTAPATATRGQALTFDVDVTGGTADSVIRVMRTRNGKTAEITTATFVPTTAGNYGTFTVTIPADEILGSDTFSVSATTQTAIDNANNSAGGSQDVRYRYAYEKAGIVIVSDDAAKTVDVNVDKTALNEFIYQAEIANNAEMQKLYVMMLGGHGNQSEDSGQITTDGRHNYDFLWAGISFNVPAGATQVSVNGGAATASGIERGLKYQYLNVAGRPSNDPSILDSTNSGVFKAPQIGMMPSSNSNTRTYELQFFDANNAPVGDLQTWTVNVNFN